ncbi:MAG: hypothetical protein WDM91_13330 [Rhizomicrobium sp.]
MRTCDSNSLTPQERAAEIARDLRAYAEAGADPRYAAKLLAAAAELDALAGAYNQQIANRHG